MRLRKDNVEKIATAEREISRLKKEGFVEVNLIRKVETAPSQQDSGDNGGEGEGTPALSAVTPENKPEKSNGKTDAVEKQPPAKVRSGAKKGKTTSGS